LTEQNPSEEKNDHPASDRLCTQADDLLTETDLLTTNQYLETLLARANSPIVVCNQDLTITRFNHAFERLTGRSAGSVIGRRVTILFPDEFHEQAKEAIGWRGTQYFDGMELPVITLDRGIRILLWHTAALIENDGKISATIAQGQDITERKKAEEELRESRQKYQALVETMSDFVWEMDAEGRYTYCSPQMEQLWGIRPETMIGKTPFDVLLPEDRAQAEQFFATLADSPRSFSGFVLSARIDEDHLIQIETSGTPFFDAAGRLLGYRGISRDITDRVRVQEEKQELLKNIQREKERLSALIENIPDEVWFADAEGNLELVNPEVMKLFSRESLNGDVRTIAGNAEVYRPDGTPRPVEEAPPLRALRGETVKSQEEIVRVPSLGMLRHRQVNAAPVRDSGGAIIGSVSVVRDITGLKEAEEAWRRSEERFRLALKNAPVSVAVQDTGLVYRWAFNPWICPADQIVGKTDDDLLPDAGQLVDLKRSVLATGRPAREKLWITSNGKRRFVEVSVEPLRDGNGTITGLGLTTVDLTEQQLAEDALRESEEKYAALFQEAPFALTLTSLPDQLIEEVNETFIRMFGYRRDELIGRSRVAFGISDRDAQNEIMTRLEEEGLIRDLECTEKTKSGEEREISVDVIPITFGGASHALSTIQDITGRKRIESELHRRQAEIRALFDNIPAGLVLFDVTPPYTVLVHNRYYQELFGEPFRSQGMAGLNVYDYAPAVEAAGVVAVFDEVIRTRLPQHHLDFPYQSNPPLESWFNWYLAPIVIDGTVVALVSMSLEVTDRHFAEEALKDGMQKLDILAESARLLLTSDPTEQIVQKICERVMDHLDCQLFLNYLIEPSSGDLCLNAFAGLSPEIAGGIGHLPLGVAVCGCVARDGEQIIAEDIQHSEEERTALVRTLGASAYACHPLMFQGAPIGTLSFGTSTRSRFTDEEIELMRAVTDLVATAMARQRTEEALRQREAELIRAQELLNATTKQSGVMIAAEDTDLCYTYFNKAYADEIRKITGKDLVIGMNMADLFADLPDEQRKSVRQWQKVLAGTALKQTIAFENPGRRPRVFEVIHTPIRDEEGAVIGAGEVSYDVTPQIRIEEELREISQYLENLLTYANAPIIVWDPEFRITRFNQAFERLTGRKEEEVIGKTPDILIPGQFRTEAMELIRKASAGNRWEVVEIPILDASGETRVILWNSATLYEEDGTSIIATIAQGQDITDRKHAEDLIILEKKHVEEAFSLLYAALESTTEGIYVVDTGRKVTSYNRNFAELWKIPESLLAIREDQEISTFMQAQVDDPLEYSERVEDLYWNPQMESYDTLKLRDGRIVERHSKPQRLGDEIIGRVWSFQDVTEKKEAEQNLLSSLHEKETLIREIHHRVKNNLQIITSLLDMTRMRSTDPATSSVLTDMMMKIKTMAQIHTRLYESRQFDRINMGRQIRDQIEDLSSIYCHSDTEILHEVEVEEIYLPVDKAIPCALIVNEILSNAYKHAFSGRKTGILRISAQQNADQVRIIISDDGTGIPEGMDIYQTRSLGFKLVRNLISQLKGSVTVTGTSGTEVVIAFPLH